MHNKQKVTLYIPPGLHRQLKIRAAVDAESMSVIVEKAIAFYMQHSDVVERVEAEDYGKTHQVHICPECDAAMVMREGQMVSLKNQPTVMTEEFLRETVQYQTGSPGEEELVPC